ncbi:MAG: restriction endonuclease subunit S [Spirochaetes bacterium]|nr:restriction endonuclease subunit S [Spirochaetota bacterium]
MKRKAYPKYKPSGVEWLGEVPEHWEIERLKRISKRLTDGSHISPDLSGSEFPFVSTVDIKNGKINFEDCIKTSTECYEYLVQNGCQPFKNDVLFSKDGTIGRTAVIDSSTDFVVASSLVIISPKVFAIVPKYLDYWLNNSMLQQEVSLQVSGAALKRISVEKIGRFSVAFPPLFEQQLIVAYLDCETAKIDSLITKKQRLLSLLSERRTALISRAVTKGLDANVQTKPSGVEWLGEVPEHWEAKKLKYISSLKSGEGITVEDIEEEDEYPVFGGNGLRGFTKQYTHNGEYVLIGRQGALCGNINYAKGKFWASEHAVVATPVEAFSVLWLGELLSIMNLNQYSLSAAQPGLAIDRIKELFIPVPSLPEQKAIAAYLDRETAKIDALSAKVETIIKRLKEYRTALISEAVTGKIDLREAV